MFISCFSQSFITWSFSVHCSPSIPVHFMFLSVVYHMVICCSLFSQYSRSFHVSLSRLSHDHLLFIVLLVFPFISCFFQSSITWSFVVHCSPSIPVHFMFLSVVYHMVILCSFHVSLSRLSHGHVLFIVLLVFPLMGTTDAEIKGPPWWESRAIKCSLFRKPLVGQNIALDAMPAYRASIPA